MQIQRKTLAQEVADRLIEGIVSNEYAVGEKLPTEPELMKIYGVGRSSIREAIKILSIKGVLDVQQGVGTFVISNTIHESLESQMDKAQIEDVQEVRSLLDAKIAAKAALHRDEEQLEKIKFYLDQRNALAEEKKALECYQADINFHIAIAEACGNSLLKEIYKITSSHILRSFEIRHNDTSSFIISQAIHERLYLAIETQNAEEAAFIAQQIVDRIY
ncbi:MAG: FadR family transcriptional regulator [Chryseobacterium sp.]|uniref:FadR/GntR family transcriptional regulator n=1 Tax=Chryseobacterium sp. TaxID=1871047 RepID=UPI000DB13792|nr:FadR/GntR family transcriptional regulator [Chryseobacterium sp.]MPS64234.1 FadR family transcriptional regulator [Chryseobacterium sp.]PZU20171.1 MAG: FadR family transcriptional regulator [Chryseobacterium sp.]